MRFFKNNFWTIASWVFVLTLIAADSFAQSNTIMDTAAGKAANVFQKVKIITFIVGGFGLVGIAYQAIIGKVKWGWFAGLAVGLALLAAAGAIVDYATGASEVQGKFGDSFSNSTGGNAKYDVGPVAR